jgi:segregation and condensation protein B
MPGKPLVYTTSKTFMDYFGINSAADLPKLKEVFSEILVEPTVVRPEAEDGPENPDPEVEPPMIVNGEGELENNGDDNPAEPDAPDTPEDAPEK